jgi:hypothetical protein
LLRKRLAPKIKELIEATGGKYATAAPTRYDTTRIDFLFQSSIDPSIRIAVAIFGPFGTERLYSCRKSVIGVACFSSDKEPYRNL